MKNNQARLNNPELCPEAQDVHLVVNDYSRKDIRWDTDIQRIHCEGCGEPMVRLFKGGRWTPWKKVVPPTIVDMPSLRTYPLGNGMI